VLTQVAGIAVDDVTMASVVAVADVEQAPVGLDRWGPRPDASRCGLLVPRGACDHGRNYATTTTTFPSFWPVSACL
jgi:hypothetical protein